MTTFERIKNLAKQKDKSLQQVARELKYGENYFYSLNAENNQPQKNYKKLPIILMFL